MSQGAWQKWDNEDYIDYLERYYGMQFTNAQKILKSAMMDESEALVIAVFNKIASPSVYLQPHFKKHMANKNKDAIPKREPLKPVNIAQKKTEDKWKPTKTDSIVWCSEKDATEAEMVRALSKDQSTWYMKPREGYQYGAVFKKVKV